MLRQYTAWELAQAHTSHGRFFSSKVFSQPAFSHPRRMLLMYGVFVCDACSMRCMQRDGCLTESYLEKVACFTPELQASCGLAQQLHFEAVAAFKSIVKLWLLGWGGDRVGVERDGVKRDEAG